MARHRTANNGDADDLRAVVHRNTKLPALRRDMVAVMPANELARFVPFNWL